MKLYLRLGFGLILTSTQMSCASITASATDRLRVSTQTPGATVSFDGDNRGPAPVTLEVPKRRSSRVVVSAPGYQPASCNTQMTPSGGYIAADIALCVLFFPIGCISFIDAGGAWNELESSSCAVKLVADPKVP